MQRARNVSRPNPHAKAVIQGKQPPSYAVISDAELALMKSVANDHDGNVKAAQTDQRAELKKASAERVANWPNTIEAQRVKKERARKERLEAEEARRILIDQEETELQRRRQELAIRKANLLLYEENDKVKNFGSKLFLTTVLEEREKQIEMKKVKDELQRQAESKWAVVNAEALRKAQEDEERKQKEIMEKAHHIKKVQIEQLDSIRQVKIKERDNNRAEGRAIARAAEEAVMEEKLEEQRRKEARHKMSLDLVEENKQQLAIKEKFREKELEEEARIEAFAKHKEQQMLERKRRVDEKFQSKLKKRQELIENQSKLLEEMQAAVEEREMKAMRDFERERREREEREENKRKEMAADMHKSRQQQLERKRSDKLRQDIQKARMQDVWRQRAEDLIDEELEERHAARDEAERTQRFQLLQQHEKRQIAAREKTKSFEEGLELQRALKEDDEMYQSYVNSIMADYVAKGRGSGLVELAVQKARNVKA